MTRSGQASLEMTAAIVGALLILFASVKICVWVAERLEARNREYENTRWLGGSIPGPRHEPVWSPKLDHPSKPLRIFRHD